MSKVVNIKYCMTPRHCSCVNKVSYAPLGYLCNACDGCPMSYIEEFIRNEEAFREALRIKNEERKEIEKLRNFCNTWFIGYESTDDIDILRRLIEQSGEYDEEGLSDKHIELLQKYGLTKSIRTKG